jgi:hypothetical protein
VPEQSEFLDGDAPTADRFQAFLARALEATDGAADRAAALVPWIYDALLSNHSVKAYGRDPMNFLRHMQAQGVGPLDVTADHVKHYKWTLAEAGMTTATAVSSGAGSFPSTKADNLSGLGQSRRLIGCSPPQGPSSCRIPEKLARDPIAGYLL